MSRHPELAARELTPEVVTLIQRRVLLFTLVPIASMLVAFVQHARSALYIYFLMLVVALLPAPGRPDVDRIARRNGPGRRHAARSGRTVGAVECAPPHGSHETRPHPRRQRLHRPPPVAGASCGRPTGRSTAWTCRPTASRDLLAEPRFHFFEGDITINREWIEYHVKKCDVVLPLVAIATPATYVREPLRVFELDFEANLPIVRACVRYRKRIVFPSTSEVYGMSRDAEFDPEASELVLGPINKPRWIYSCAKQLMDRVIHAYGMQEGLDYTLFRPFNWIGAGLDSINTAKEGSSRVITQFLGHIVRGEPIKLVDGGTQKRAFTYIDDGIAALMKIIANPDGIATGKIYNIGNPANNWSVRELAREDARARAALSGVRGQRRQGQAGRHDGRRLLRQAATRTCRTACRRSPTRAPTSTGSRSWRWTTRWRASSTRIAARSRARLGKRARSSS